MWRQPALRDSRCCTNERLVCGGRASTPQKAKLNLSHRFRYGESAQWIINGLSRAAIHLEVGCVTGGIDSLRQEAALADRAGGESV